MKKVLILIVCCFTALFTLANDGAFYAAGNQLIPIMETDIQVKKEVLTITRVGNHLEVTVYYEFFNPVGEKQLLVGFEAASPYNSPLDPLTTFPLHPHIHNFKVTMNGESLPFEVSHVELERYENGNTVRNPYYRDGHMLSWTRKQIEDTLAKSEYPEDFPVDYVYHFKATFRPGLNIIQHTYEFDNSSSVEDEFYFPYILTAANRWANHQIDDFSLIINPGEHVSIHVLPEFFDSLEEWNILGTGKVTIDSVWVIAEGKQAPVFHIQEGGISFHKNNFHPAGELYIHNHRIWSYLWGWDNEDENSAPALIETLKEQYHPLYFPNDDSDFSSLTTDQRRILKNLPFAYRGYIFKNKELQDFFKSTAWYTPNPNYQADLKSLPPKEQQWVEFWK